ncbi:MAG: mercury(II) reductase [Nitrososphaerota archaeon]|nr:mercury(II) reductase [Nitrososphaerota archaeon]
MATSKKYDVAILGRGAAAFSAAIKASELTNNNSTIAMVGTGPIGGTCVNVGCVPSKYLLEASHSHFYPRHPRFQGIERSHPGFDFSKVMEGLRNLVSRFRHEKYEKVLESYPNIEVIEGRARFRSPNEIEVSNHDQRREKAITGKHIVIATGSRPTAPPIEGLDTTRYITSDTVWDLTERPRRLAVIGGGAIGLEIGQAFMHLDSDVSIVEAMPRIIPTAEPDISEALKRSLTDEGMEFYIKARINRVWKENGKKILEVVTAKGKSKVECDEILVATGRAPNTDQLSLDRAGVETDGRGFIKVDSTMKTSKPRIYAAGDCISKRLMLETLAAREGVVAASNIMGERATIDYPSVPWAVFTNPQVAAVGVTEEEFVKQTGSCSCRVVQLKDVPKATMLGEGVGLVKVIINPSNGKVVGLHILSPLATEYVLEGAYAIKHGLTFEDILNTTHIFPTLSEGVKLAAQSFVRDISKMSCCVE